LRPLVRGPPLFTASFVHGTARDFLRATLRFSALEGAFLDVLVLPLVLSAPRWHGGLRGGCFGVLGRRSCIARVGQQFWGCCDPHRRRTRGASPCAPPVAFAT